MADTSVQKERRQAEGDIYVLPPNAGEKTKEMLELDITIVMPTKQSRHAHATLLLYNATDKQPFAERAF
jgi:hypothetical protein